VRRSYRLLMETVFLLRSANTLGDRWLLSRYLLHNCWDRLTKRRFAPAREIQVAFREVRVIFQEFSSELTSYLEIYGGRIYEMLPQFVPQAGWVVLDIGANLGLYSIRQAGRVGPGGRVYAFEPNPNVASRLERNLLLNRVYNVTVIPKAVYSITGNVSFALNPRSSCAGMVVETTGSPRSHVQEREAVTLDDFVQSASINHIDLLKIDVEGGELEVLRGAKVALARTRNVVLEYHSPDLKAAVTSALVGEAGLRLVMDYEPERVLYFQNDKQG
jgi:FkbM family methyltransferase